MLQRLRLIPCSSTLFRTCLVNSSIVQQRDLKDQRNLAVKEDLNHVPLNEDISSHRELPIPSSTHINPMPLEKNSLLTNKGKLKPIPHITARSLQWDCVPTPLKLLNASHPSIIIQKNPPDPLQTYLSLSKSRLSALVVSTAMAGYAVAPNATFVPVEFVTLSFGVALVSAAANSVNQIVEREYDSMMRRTQDRVMVRGIVSVPQAWSFAATSATIGISTLALCNNELTAAIAALNLILYTSVYTPMKRMSILNTWAGAIVGALPPLMGWAAVTNGLTFDALPMFLILFSWQFPHFNALSWNIATDYDRAGYQMMASKNKPLCLRTALTHSVYLTLTCLLMPVITPDVTSWSFALDSLPLNLVLVYFARRFYKKADASSARSLFRFTLFHLPALLLLLIVNARGNRRDKKTENSQSILNQDTVTNTSITSNANDKFLGTVNIS